MKHFESIEVLSIFRMSIPPPLQTQSPPQKRKAPIENFVATVLHVTDSCHVLRWPVACNIQNTVATAGIYEISCGLFLIWSM